MVLSRFGANTALKSDDLARKIRSLKTARTQNVPTAFFRLRAYVEDTAATAHILSDSRLFYKV